MRQQIQIFHNLNPFFFPFMIIRNYMCSPAHFHCKYSQTSPVQLWVAPLGRKYSQGSTHGGTFWSQLLSTQCTQLAVNLHALYKLHVGILCMRSWILELECRKERLKSWVLEDHQAHTCMLKKLQRIIPLIRVFEYHQVHTGMQKKHRIIPSAGLNSEGWQSDRIVS